MGALTGSGLPIFESGDHTRYCSPTWGYTQRNGVDNWFPYSKYRLRRLQMGFQHLLLGRHHDQNGILLISILCLYLMRSPRQGQRVPQTTSSLSKCPLSKSICYGMRFQCLRSQCVSGNQSTLLLWVGASCRGVMTGQTCKGIENGSGGFVAPQISGIQQTDDVLPASWLILNTQSNGP